ncbi:YncE family protein [Alicyclobacillus sp. ALC3]|uniref:YncE family protein n=1 Tax=Alicyclobacillus sp. ALC3 TaxID=2796143 RepID=UPI00237928FF|nr:YncE family protein [Alicyclobacillus sp. ALC3]WDL99801.1 hypothetical protein JC200_23815 [Alicyclobacillus sp. ALC3]
MNRKTKIQAGIGIGAVASMLFAGIFANTADAYSLYPNYPNVDYSVVYNDESGGALSHELSMTRTGDEFHVVKEGQYPALAGGYMYAAVEQAMVSDGQGSWPVIQADMTTNRTGSGYLLIATPNESSDFATWVKRLGGNLSFVENYMHSHHDIIALQDIATGQTYTYYPLSLMVNESGAVFGNPTAVPNGKIYKGSNGKSYPEYTTTQHIYTSRPPVATGLSAVDATTGSANITQGDPVTFTAKSAIYIYPQLGGNQTSGRHYDAIQLRNNSTGQTYWVTGSGSSDINSMTSEIGGHGYFSDTFTYNANLPVGTYTASFWAGDIVDRISATPATNTFTVAPSGQPVISLNASPSSTTAGQSSTLTANASNVPPGDIIKIIDKSGANTLSGANSYTNNQVGATQLQTQVTSQTAQTVNYEAELVNQTTDAVDATATASVQWGASAVLPSPPVAPSIELSANPQSLGSGQPSTVSYAVSNLPSGDSVSLTGTTTSGTPVFSTSSYTSSGRYIQVQSPVNGNSTTVNYSADVLNDAGQLVARSNNVSVTWTSTPPSIALQASPTKMVPGQPTRLTYTVSGGLPAGDTVSVTGSGNAAHPWNTAGQTSTSESDTETEDPSGGQTIAETYTATIRSSSGQPIASAQTSVQWTNAWTGTIQLTASPNVLAVGKSTTLTATTSTPIPSGYILVIVDEQTGQTVASGSASTLVGQYASGSARTYDFVAYVTDGYVQTGPLSNTDQVQWVGASLSATPSALDINHASTITANAQNMPSGDWLILFDETTGQVLATSQSSTVSTSQTESTAQTDSYVAYVSTSNSVSSAFVTSPIQAVKWYSVTLTASPTTLPVGSSSNLAASAQNVPSGYMLDIVDQTTGQTIASGHSGQSTLNALQTKSSPATDHYVAQVVKPGNPSIPGLSVPASGGDGLAATVTTGWYPQAVAYDSANGNLYVADQGDGTVTVISGTTNAVLTKLNLGASTMPYSVAYDPSNGYVYVPNLEGNDVYVINGSTNSVIGTVGVGSYPQGITYDSGNHDLYVTNEGSSSVSVINGMSDVGTIGGVGSYPQGITYDAGNGDIYVTSNSSDVAVINGNTNSLVTIINSIGGDPIALAYDPKNGDVYSANIYGNVTAINGSTNAVVATITGLGSGPDGIGYDAKSGDLYVASQNSATVGIINPTTNAVIDTVTLPSGNDLDGVEYDPANGNVYVAGGYLSNSVFIIKPGSGQTNTFPFWTFQTAPLQVPATLFTTTAQSSSDGNGSIWVSASSSQPNGTAFFQSTLTLSQTQSVTLSMPYVDDYAQVYVDGQPVMKQGSGGGVGGSIPNTSSATVTLSAGQHQIIIEAMNTNHFTSPNNNTAGVALTATGSSGNTLLTTSSPSEWTTTGYVSKLPAGWFSSEVGTFTWTEYVLKENSSPNISQEATYTVTNTPQSVSATSSPVTVQWYQWHLALAANPTSLNEGNPATLTATSAGAPSGSVIQIWNTTDNKMVGQSPANATSLTATWTEQKAVTDTFVAYFIDPTTGKQLQSSNDVQVTWKQIPLTLTSAIVTHTPGWLKNLQSYNAYYATRDPSLVRPLSYFWAGEEFVLRAEPSVSTIAQATVTFSGLNYSSFAPFGAPTQFTVNLTYNPVTGLLEGNSNPNWSTWFQYLKDGTYSVTFWAKSTDNQVATAQASFTIDAPWVSGNDPKTYFHEHQTW